MRWEELSRQRQLKSAGEGVKSQGDRAPSLGQSVFSLGVGTFAFVGTPYNIETEPEDLVLRNPK